MMTFLLSLLERMNSIIQNAQTFKVLKYKAPWKKDEENINPNQEYALEFF